MDLSLPMDPANCLQLSDAATASSDPDTVKSLDKSYNWTEASLDVDAEYLFNHNADKSYPQLDSFFDDDSKVAHVDSFSGDFAQEHSHGGYVCLSDIALDSTLNIPIPSAQPHQYLCHWDHVSDGQDAKHLTNLWPSYDFSTNHDAAEDYLHADVADFGLLMQDVEVTHALVEQPVIHLRTSTSQCSSDCITSESTECRRRLQIVRRWLSNHVSRPYPTPTEKAELAASAGCSERQLNICFRNTRAREKRLFDGLTNVGSAENGANTESCKNISTHSGYTQSRSVVFTQKTSPCGMFSLPVTNTSDSDSSPSRLLSDPGYHTLVDSPVVGTQVSHNSRGDLAHQVTLDMFADQYAVIPKRKGRMYHAQRHQDSASKQLHCVIPTTASLSGLRTSEKKFPCTVCPQSFKNASEWKRHEASVHGYNEREWTCMLTDAFKLHTECVFCLEQMDSIDHLNEHAIAPCSNKCAIERTFPRKDLLKQHVLLAHLANGTPSVRRKFNPPVDWSTELDSSPGGPGSRWCGFCRCMLETTTKRMDHVAQHFRNGQHITNWIRM